MSFFTKIPDWVKNYPAEPDRLALTQLAKASKGSFEKPREMNFRLYNLQKGSELEAIQARVLERGWECTVAPDEAIQGTSILTATKKDYVMSHESYGEDSLFFMRLAEQYSIGYDGWFASN